MRARPVRILLCLWVLSISRLVAAGSPLRIDVWTTEQGLPQNAVTAILQTRDGFIWFSTFGGIVRFDGAEMHVFTTVNAPGMKTTRVTGLVEAPDGALWAATEARGAMRYSDGRFVTFTTSDGLPDPHVGALFVENGSVIADTPKGLRRWTGTRFEPYASAQHLSASDAQRQLLTRQTDANVWYRDAAGIHKLAGGRIVRTVAGLQPLRAFEDREGRLWMESPDRPCRSSPPPV